MTRPGRMVPTRTVPPTLTICPIVESGDIVSIQANTVAKTVPITAYATTYVVARDSRARLSALGPSVRLVLRIRIAVRTDRTAARIVPSDIIQRSTAAGEFGKTTRR